MSYATDDGSYYTLNAAAALTNIFRVTISMMTAKTYSKELKEGNTVGKGE